MARTIAQRAADRPEGSYTAELLAQGVGKASQKVGEEAVEVVVAANSEDDERLASEAADLLYHLLVLLQARGVPLDAVLRRAGVQSTIRGLWVMGYGLRRTPEQPIAHSQ